MKAPLFAAVALLMIAPATASAVENMLDCPAGQTVEKKPMIVVFKGSELSCLDQKGQRQGLTLIVDANGRILHRRFFKDGWIQKDVEYFPNNGHVKRQKKPVVTDYAYEKDLEGRVDKIIMKSLGHREIIQKSYNGLSDQMSGVTVVIDDRIISVLYQYNAGHFSQNQPLTHHERNESLQLSQVLDKIYDSKAFQDFPKIDISPMGEVAN